MRIFQYLIVTTWKHLTHTNTDRHMYVRFSQKFCRYLDEVVEGVWGNALHEKGLQPVFEGRENGRTSDGHRQHMALVACQAAQVVLPRPQRDCFQYDLLQRVYVT